LVPICYLYEDHVHDFFHEWDVGGGEEPSGSGDDWYFESIPHGKFDTSVTDITKHLISCLLVYGFGMVEGIGVSGKH
jgi:hypothetical protein